MERPRKSIIRDMMSEVPVKASKADRLIQRSYYLTPELVKAVAFKSAKTGMDKSEVVRTALEAYCSEELMGL